MVSGQLEVLGVVLSDHWGNMENDHRGTGLLRRQRRWDTLQTQALTHYGPGYMSQDGDCGGD